MAFPPGSFHPLLLLLPRFRYCGFVGVRSHQVLAAMFIHRPGGRAHNLEFSRPAYSGSECHQPAREAVGLGSPVQPASRSGSNMSSHTRPRWPVSRPRFGLGCHLPHDVRPLYRSGHAILAKVSGPLRYEVTSSLFAGSISLVVALLRLGFEAEPTASLNRTVIRHGALVPVGHDPALVWRQTQGLADRAVRPSHHPEGACLEETCLGVVSACH